MDNTVYNYRGERRAFPNAISTLESRYHMERLIYLFEKIHYEPLSSDEVIEWNALFNILRMIDDRINH